MIRAESPVFSRILDAIVRMPVVDAHEHMRAASGDLGQAYPEPVMALIQQYVSSDLWASGADDAEIALLQDPACSTDQKWPVFSRLWANMEHTAYARVTKLVLRQVYGVERLTRSALDRVAEVSAQHTAARSLQMLEDANIKAVIADCLLPTPRERSTRYVGNHVLKALLDGKWQAPAIWRPVFSLPFFHELRQREFVDNVALMANCNITSLAEYEEAVYTLIQRTRATGAVALKDQSAYRRIISYELPPRSDAERIFNRLLMDPRSQLSWPDAKPLDDYLFHQFLRFARELRLPVQLHTGHMAGIRNRVDKANAAHLAPVLELHTQVQFDLFHGNWPYMGDILFLGKNYPNVRLNLCWLAIIDPLYAQEMVRRLVVTVPHSKVHAFGGDYWDAPEYSVAHLTIALEVLAAGLADTVESGWLEEYEAVSMAADWLYNNPNAFYRLGLPEFKPA